MLKKRILKQAKWVIILVLESDRTIIIIALFRVAQFQIFKQTYHKFKTLLENGTLNAFITTGALWMMMFFEYCGFIYFVTAVCTDNKDWHKSIIVTQICNHVIGFTCQGSCLMLYSSRKKKRFVLHTHGHKYKDSLLPHCPTLQVQ